MALEQSSDNRQRVLAISGSLRKTSFNTGLLRAAQEVAPDWMDVEIFDIRGLPFYDGDLEAQSDPEPVRALKSAIRESDAVMFATPEYNWGTSGVMKNTIDWLHGTGKKARLWENRGQSSAPAAGRAPPGPRCSC